MPDLVSQLPEAAGVVLPALGEVCLLDLAEEAVV